ncbi:MAG TPA: HNH endonuclease signature motif containing protein [Rubrivivax sp.]|nr:HNH endonuclease signature motif containing protein [Rubrivivax sp.]HRY86480.1 HNH endonuclease signature motif containing protein [Rubrivivax sp.]
MTNNELRMQAKERRLTAEMLRAELCFDYEAGVFYSYRSEMTRTVGYKTSDGYTNIRLLGHTYRAHRLAWLYDKGRWPLGQIDHADRDRSNNRIENLRECDQAFNMENQGKAHKDSKSGLLGAYFHKARRAWYSQIRVNKELHHLGTFQTAEEAHEAYLAAKRKVHKGCAI